MKPVVRWLVAGTVTIGAFALVAWVCGAVILTEFMKDPGVRWGVAGAVGVAVAALAALWGQSFATAEGTSKAASCDAGRTTVPGSESGDTGNIISGGTFHGSVIQGRNISLSQPTSSCLCDTSRAALPQDRGSEGQG